jgi:hypothetical protein
VESADCMGLANLIGSAGVIFSLLELSGMMLRTVVKALFYDYRNCCAYILEYTKWPWCQSLVSVW